MKKVILFVAVVIATSFASCKRDYICKCSYGNSSVTSGATIHDTKKQANADCATRNYGAYTCVAVKQ